MQNFLYVKNEIQDKLTLKFDGKLVLISIPQYELKIDSINLSSIKSIDIDLTSVNFMDTASCVFINTLQKKFTNLNIKSNILTSNKDIEDVLLLVNKYKNSSKNSIKDKKDNFLNSIGKTFYENIFGFLSFMAFMGKIFRTKLHYLRSYKNIRFKEIAFEINESAIKAIWIVSVTSFLIGLVIAYQSSYQLKIYGANIFIVDMLGLSVLRELSPVITAIVIAGRSGSAFAAQIGAMKITQELDAMRTMGFDPFIFLVSPKIIALVVSMPILIFISDIAALFGGMLVANLDLNISTQLFLDRFSDVISIKHFFVGIVKAPFFAFIIASIGIYRGLMVKDDTQSIGINTTKSVVESIFAVIICDAIFSIAFTNLGI